MSLSFDLGREARSPSRRSRALVIILLVIVGGASAWFARRPALRGLGAFLVTEDQLVPGGLAVVSNASVRAGALEAIRLFHDGIVSQVLIPEEPHDPLNEQLRQIGVPALGASELMRSILEHGNVPARAIVVLPGGADGTGAEVARVATFVREHRAQRLLFITARSHTARAAWLLRRALPDDVQVAVHSPPADAFDPAGWWQHPDQSREVVTEYLHWANVLARPGLWSRAPADAPRTAVR